MKTIYAIVASMLLSGAAFAQETPPRDAGGGRGDGPPLVVRDRGQRGGGGPGMGLGRPDGPPGPGFGGGDGPGMEQRIAKFDALRGYLDAVDRYARLARDPANSGIAAVVATADILRPRGADVAIEYFTKLLPEVKTPAVQRAIRILLVDLYKSAGKQDQALEQLKMLMTADTSNEPATLAPPPVAPPAR